MSNLKQKAAILGYGRFGALWAELNREFFDVSICETTPERAALAEDKGFKTISLKECLESDVVFFCGPNVYI